jgi:Orsellinic acid/F9775 biosynthesis cluster protein D
MPVTERDCDPLLVQFHLAVFPPFVICQDCRSAHTLPALLHHLAHDHRDYVVHVDRIVLALEKRGIRARVAIPPKLTTPIPGVLIFQGLRCPELNCDYLSAEEGDFRIHVSKCHIGSAVAGEPCKLQEVHVSEGGASDSVLLMLDPCM